LFNSCKILHTVEHVLDTNAGKQLS
jgi:hypothetical protein